MTTLAVTIGLTLVKLSTIGAISSATIAGIKWFSKFDPKLNKNGKREVGGEENDGIERLRKEVRSRG